MPVNLADSRMCTATRRCFEVRQHLRRKLIWERRIEQCRIRAANGAFVEFPVEWGEVRIPGVMIFDHRKTHYAVLVCKLLLQQHLSEELRHVFRRIAECTASPRPEDNGIVAMQ